MTGQTVVISSENLIYNIMENRDFLNGNFLFSFQSQMKTADFGSSHERSVIKMFKPINVFSFDQ